MTDIEIQEMNIAVQKRMISMLEDKIQRLETELAGYRNVGEDIKKPFVRPDHLTVV